jgi:hypothetical protein
MLPTQTERSVLTRDYITVYGEVQKIQLKNTNQLEALIYFRKLCRALLAASRPLALAVPFVAFPTCDHS